MPDVRFQFTSPDAASQWKARRSSLDRSLSTLPDSQWSWLWQIRLRICTFLIRRYGSLADRDDAPKRVDCSPAQLTESTEPFATTNPIRRVIPVRELRRRTRLRDRQSPTLEHLAAVGRDTRELTAILLLREEAKESRRQAIEDDIVPVLLVLLFTCGALLTIACFVGVGLVRDLTASF